MRRQAQLRCDGLSGAWSASRRRTANTSDRRCVTAKIMDSMRPRRVACWVDGRGVTRSGVNSRRSKGASMMREARWQGDGGGGGGGARWGITCSSRPLRVPGGSSEVDALEVRRGENENDRSSNLGAGVKVAVGWGGVAVEARGGRDEVEMMGIAKSVSITSRVDCFDLAGRVCGSGMVAAVASPIESKRRGSSQLPDSMIRAHVSV